MSIWKVNPFQKGFPCLSHSIKVPAVRISTWKVSHGNIAQLGAPTDCHSPQSVSLGCFKCPVWWHYLSTFCCLRFHSEASNLPQVGTLVHCRLWRALINCLKGAFSHIARFWLRSQFDDITFPTVFFLSHWKHHPQGHSALPRARPIGQSSWYLNSPSQSVPAEGLGYLIWNFPFWLLPG